MSVQESGDNKSKAKLLEAAKANNQSAKSLSELENDLQKLN